MFLFQIEKQPEVKLKEKGPRTATAEERERYPELFNWSDNEESSDDKESNDKESNEDDDVKNEETGDDSCSVSSEDGDSE